MMNIIKPKPLSNSPKDMNHNNKRVQGSNTYIKFSLTAWSQINLMPDEIFHEDF